MYRDHTMSQVNGIATNTPVQRTLNAPVQKSIASDAPKQLPAVDKVEINGIGHLLSALKANDVRVDKVADIKAALAAGTYEDDAKLDGAIDKLLDDVLK